MNTTITQHLEAIDADLFQKYPGSKAWGLANRYILNVDGKRKISANLVANPLLPSESEQITFDDRHPIAWFYRADYINVYEHEKAYGAIPFFVKAEHRMSMVIFGFANPTRNTTLLYPYFLQAVVSSGNTIIDVVQLDPAVIEQDEFPLSQSLTETFLFKIQFKTTLVLNLRACC